MRVKLIQIRKARGFTQQRLSQIVGVSRSHYSQIETGDKTPSLRVAVATKSALSYYDDDIFFNEKRPNTGLKAV